MRKISMTLLLLDCILVSLVLAGCAKVEVVDLNLSYTEPINTTKYVPLPRNETEEGFKALPNNTVDSLCTEKVLLAIRSCKWQENNLKITVKNNGFKNVTMAFYLLSDEGQVGSLFNDTLFMAGAEWGYTLPLKELEEQYGNIIKIQATPVLAEGDTYISCSNKKLPILVEACG